MKRLYAIALAAIMTLSLMPLSVYALNEDLAAAPGPANTSARQNISDIISETADLSTQDAIVDTIPETADLSTQEAIMETITETDLSAQTATVVGLENLPNPVNKRNTNMAGFNYTTTDVIEDQYFGVSAEKYLDAGIYELVMVVQSWDSNVAKAHGGIFYDAKMNESVDRAHETERLSTDQYMDCTIVKIEESGTYYIGAYSSTNTCQATGVSVGFYLNKMNRTSATLKAGKAYGVYYEADETEAKSFKFKAESTGYLRIDTGSTTLVTLLKGSKTVGKQMSRYYNPVYFGVKKGTTYTIKISPEEDRPNAGYYLKLTNKAVSQQGGSSKSKATALKVNKAKSGMVAAGTNSANWYKFTAPKTGYVKIVITGDTNDSLDIVISRRKEKATFTLLYTDLEPIGIGNQEQTVQKGDTLYINIKRSNSTSSGYFRIKAKYF